MRAPYLLAFIPLAFATNFVDAPRAVLAPLGYHDNTEPAGELRGGTLALSLEVGLGMWHPNGDERPGVAAFAWGEEGRRLSLPGPLLRVPVGTHTRIRIRNRTDSTLVIRGFGDTPNDTLVLAPGASGEVHGRPAKAGNRMYVAHVRSRTPVQRAEVDAHAVGAFVVDAPETSRVREHVLVITSAFYHRDSTGALTFNREIFAVNGRPWPHTQRLRGTVGDSLRFRVLNASQDVHPIHLHGAYFRVEAVGDLSGDTALVGDDQRQVVTEFMTPVTTMTMAWMPERPGTWLLHCHLTFHVIPNIAFGSEALSPEAYGKLLEHGAAHADHDNHVEKGMGGLMMAIEVPPPAGWRLPVSSRRVLRLLLPNDSQPGDARAVFAPSLEEGGRVAGPIRRNGPGAMIVLQEGEPSTIRVVNGSRSHAAIHWHGLELESLFDGVVGLGGTPNQRHRAIAPRDSFDALMTPPRAGTFIYHTHLSEVRQQEAGLYGTLIVLPRGESWNAERDHVFLASTYARLGNRLNGDTLLPPLQLLAGEHRLRLINITTGGAGLRFLLTASGGDTSGWSPVAKDGMDLPASRRVTRRAVQHIAMGETYDFIIAPAPGRYQLELRTSAGQLRARQPIEVLSPP